MSDALFDLLHGILHLGKTKLEAGGEQPAGHDIATLDDQFGLSPMNKRRDFEHPTRRGQSEPGAAFPAKDLHHLSLLNRVRRSYVDWPAEIVSINQPLHSPAEIVFVDPRNELFPTSYRTSQAKPREASKHPEHPTLSGGEDHRGAQRDFPCGRGLRLIKRFFPSASYFDGKRVLGLRSRVDYAGGLIRWLVEGVFVDGCSAGVQPDPRRCFAANNCFAEHARRIDSRLENLSPVARVVSAVH